MSRGRAAAVAWLAACAGLVAPAAADEWTPQGVRFGIGHSYSSASALAQPATFVLVAEEERPLLTLLDAGILARGPLGRLGAWEGGARASAGSARPAARRVYGGTLRGWRAVDPLLFSLGAEYQADGDFDVEKGTVLVETTPLRGAPGLGRWIRPGLRLRWRPWLGLAYGNVYDVAAGRADIESHHFWRGQARVEVNYRPAGRALCDLEATSWLVHGDIRGTSFLKAALSVPVAGRLSLAADLELGRQPPRFEHERRVGLGLGYYRALRSD